MRLLPPKPSPGEAGSQPQRIPTFKENAPKVQPNILPLQLSTPEAKRSTINSRQSCATETYCTLRIFGTPSWHHLSCDTFSKEPLGADIEDDEPEPIPILRDFGYSELEAYFLYLVVTHSGYLTRQQFLKFTGKTKGWAVHRFHGETISKRSCESHAPAS